MNKVSGFPKKLKRIRVRERYTQEALARELGVSQNAVYNWENGKREPSIDMLNKIAEVLETSVAILVDNKIEVDLDGNNTVDKGSVE